MAWAIKLKGQFQDLFENQQRAIARLSIIVPLTIGLIFILLYTAFDSAALAGLIIANVPFGLVGGILALYASPYRRQSNWCGHAECNRADSVPEAAPMLFSQGVGAETQRPLATVVVGGLISSTALTLLLLPLMYEWLVTRRNQKSNTNHTDVIL